MAYQFIATSRPRYFSRNGDIVFHNSEHFLIKVKPLIDRDLSFEKFFVGFVINRKVGNAVVRNKVKRRLRVIFNDFQEIHKEYCYILIARPSIANLSFAELLEKVCNSIGVLFNNYRFVNYVKLGKYL